MGFVQYDHVVQTLPTNGTDDAFAVGALSGHATKQVTVFAFGGRASGFAGPQNPQLRIFPGLKNPLSCMQGASFPK
jgi:hypothetical protein